MEENTKPKNNNEKLIIGIVVGAVLGFLIYWSLQVVGDFSETIFKVLIAVILIISALFLALVWFRNRIIRRFFGKDIPFETLLTETQETITIFTEKTADTLPLEEGDKTKIKTIAPRLVNYLLWSNFRNWGLRILTSFVLGLGGIVTTILVLNQNKILQIQTSIQEQQATVQKAELNRAFAAEQNDMFDIRSAVIQEGLVGVRFNEDSNDTRIMTSRIVSLSKSLQPYKLLKEDLTIGKLLWSPQRGQLLVSIVESGKLDNSITPSYLIEDLFKRSDFSFAVLKGVNFEHANLTNINLTNSDMSSSYLNNTNLTNASLTASNLKNVDFDDAILAGTDLSDSDLTKANLRFTVMNRNTDLTNAVLDSAYVHRKDWLIYIRDSLQVKGSKILFENYSLTQKPCGSTSGPGSLNCFMFIKKQ